MLPTFIYIGPDKSGSTWIYEALREHPEVFVPRVKDIYFFDKYFNKGIKWYESFFKNGIHKKAIGEISHDYLFSSQASHRIRDTIPNVKLITCLRDPVERAFSEYLFLYKHGLVRSNFLKAIVEFPEIIQNSCYAKPLQNYFSIFDRGQILVLRFEDLKHQPGIFIKRIYSFIGVDDRYRPKTLNRKILPASKPRSYWTAYMAKKTAMFIREMGFPGLVGILKQSRVIDRALYVPYGEGDLPKLDEHEETYLRNIFIKEINFLEELLGEDFSNWRMIRDR